MEKIIQFALQYGIIVFLIKFTVDRVLSTEIETELESNYNRAFREISNWLIFVIVLCLASGVIYIESEMYDGENKRVDVVTSEHISLTKKQFNEYRIKSNKESKEAAKKIIILLLIVLLIMLSMLYIFFRTFWYNNYKRKVYIYINTQKFYIVKKIDKERVLFKNEDNTSFRIMSFDKLTNTSFCSETIKERKNRRSEYYYKLIKDRNRLADLELPIRIFLVIMVLIVFILLWVAYQQSGIITVLSSIGTLCIWGGYTITQYKNGKNARIKLNKKKRSKKRL